MFTQCLHGFSLTVQKHVDWGIGDSKLTVSVIGCLSLYSSIFTELLCPELTIFSTGGVGLRGGGERKSREKSGITEIQSTEIVSMLTN